MSAPREPAQKALTLWLHGLACGSIMRLGINTFLFTSPFTNDSTKLFKQFKQWGFDTIEIPIEDPSHIDPAHVKRELDKHGLVCGSVCACLGPDRDLRGTPKQQKNSLDYLKKVIDQMVVLDCPSLVGPVYSSVGRADAVPPAEYKKQWKTVVKNLKTLAAYAQKRGKQICMEPLNRFETDFINTCDQALEDGQGGRQPGPEAAPGHVPHEHRGEEPGGGDSQSRQAAGPFPRLRQRPRHAGQRSY